MAFHIDLNTQGINSYITALSKWQTTVPWRGATDTNVRPLDKRAKKHMTIRKLNDESVALTLYGTDVVIYHPDDTITLTPYSSISTDKFANHFTPQGINVHFNDALGYVVNLKVEPNDFYKPYGVWNMFKFSGAFRLKKGPYILDAHGNLKDHLWIIDERTTTQIPFQRYKVDRKRAKQASEKYGLNTFTDWFKAVQEMGGFKEHRKSSWFWNDAEMAALLLSDREDKWQEFLKHVWGFEAVKKFKELVYRVEKVGYVEEAMSLKGWDEWRSFTQAQSRNRYFV